MKVKAVLVDPVKRSFDFVDVVVDGGGRTYTSAKAILGCGGLHLEIWYDGHWIDAPYWSFNYEFKAMCAEMPDVPDDNLDEYHCVEWVHNAADVGADLLINKELSSPRPRHRKMPGRVLYVKGVHTVPYRNGYRFASTNMTENDMAMIKACVRFVDPVRE